MPKNTMSESINRIPLGTQFRQKREEKGLLVRQVAAVTELDQAIISRIENNDRLPTKEQLNKLAGLYGLDLKDVYSTWLSEKMIRDYGDEPYAPEAFREAHDQVILHYRTAAEPRTDYSSLADNSANHSGNSKKSPPKQRGKPSKI
jgi:HTH-type transcriptional regulator, competence development regulator